VILIGHIQQDI